jgi:HAD superfamily hydrolase (TIGR01509 family)
MKAVIFDMDGVLIDSEPTYIKIEHDMLDELGIKVDEKTKSSLVGMQMENAWNMLKSKFIISKTIEELVIDERNRFKKYMESGEVLPVKGAFELLKSVRDSGFKTAIASSSYKDEIKVSIELFGFGDYLDVVVSGEEVENGKPNPDIFNKAAKELGVNNKDCIVIEDSKNGVIAAKEANMLCIGYNDIETLDQDLSIADLVVTNIKDITVEKIKLLLNK